MLTNKPGKLNFLLSDAVFLANLSDAVNLCVLSFVNLVGLRYFFPCQFSSSFLGKLTS